MNSGIKALGDAGSVQEAICDAVDFAEAGIDHSGSSPGEKFRGCAPKADGLVAVEDLGLGEKGSLSRVRANRATDSPVELGVAVI